MYFAAKWYVDVYGKVSFDAILYTLTAALSGVQDGLVFSFLRSALVPALAAFGLTAFLVQYSAVWKFSVFLFQKLKIFVYPLGRVLKCMVTLVLCAALLFSAAQMVDLPEFIRQNAQTSTLYETQFVDPAAAEIQFPEKKRNLIYIMLESMETSFYAQEQGGVLAHNAIPELYELAEQNTRFARQDGKGGMIAATGTTWTIGSMVGQTAGIPLKTPPGVSKNSYGEDDSAFLPGVTTMMDILHDEGYYQALMVGSNSIFGGRKSYYLQHGTDHVYDLATAEVDELIPYDYYVWWGMEDEYLFEYAKRELPKLAAGDQPFAFTLLTVDTHHVGGYVCGLCQDEFDEQYENVFACSSRQTAAFIDWIRQQDFYENTTIILCGDHPSMDGDYSGRCIPRDYERTMYNCFINAPAEPSSTESRAFCAMDMLPTTLAAMGCTIPGERLGLGTNLFSDRPTLMEEMGVEAFQQELAKRSDYYIVNFFYE